MKRRDYLATTTAVLALGGCTDSDSGNKGSVDDCTIEQSTESVEPVPVTVNGQLENETADAVLDLQWNARSQDGTEMSPDSNAGYSADEGYKTLVFRVEFTNTTSEDVPITTKVFDGIIETPDTTEEVDRMSISARIVDEVTLKPDGETDAHMAYEIPNESKSFTLQAVPSFGDGSNVAFNPSCNRELPIELGEFSV
jgi:hypothetical protein